MTRNEIVGRKTADKVILSVGQSDEGINPTIKEGESRGGRGSLGV